MGNYEPVEGDRVRVVMEGEVTWTSSESGRFTLESQNTVLPRAEHVVSIEKLEPPVRVFKPGDRLRRKSGAPYEITLTDTGYVQHVSNHNGHHDYSDTDEEWFNSDNFELVLEGRRP